jgi:hypothetical protein
MYIIFYCKYFILVSDDDDNLSLKVRILGASKLGLISELLRSLCVLLTLWVLVDTPVVIVKHSVDLRRVFLLGSCTGREPVKVVARVRFG